MFLDTLVLLYLHSRLYTKERLRTLGVEGVFIHLLALVDASLSFPHGLKIQFGFIAQTYRAVNPFTSFQKNSWQ